MPGSVPPKIDDAPRSFIGVGTRELTISLVGIIGAAFIFFIKSMPMMFRVFFAVIVAGAALYIAFGRDQTTGRRIEEMLTDFLTFHGREKFYQKGVVHEERNKWETTPKPEKPKRTKPVKDAMPRKTFAKVEPLSLTWTAAFKVCSVALLAMLLTYLWGGGLEKALNTYKIMDVKL